MSKKNTDKEVEVVEEMDVIEPALDDEELEETVSTEQASLALANMLSRGVKMADAKQRLGIK